MACLLSSCGGSHGNGGDGDPIAGERDPAACTDFYAHANGAWLAATPIPTDHSSVDISTGLAARNQKEMLTDLERSAAGQGKALTQEQQAVVDLHASRTDAAAIERLALAPLADELALIDGMTDTARLPLTWGLLMRRGVRLPVSLRIDPFDDPERSGPAPTADRLRVEIDRIGPARATDDSAPDAVNSTPAFQAHIARTLELTGMSAADAADASLAVAAIEQALAAPEGVDPTGRSEAPGFAMTDLLHAVGVPDALPRTVDDTSLRVLGDLQASHDAQAWRGFMRWRLARSFTDELPARFAAERARWDPPALAAVTEDQQPVDARIAFLARVLPRQLDLFFTGRILPADTLVQTQDIERQVRAALHRHLDGRSWLNAASRTSSHRLLDTVDMVYPALENTAEDRALASLPVPAMRRDALLDNVRRAAAYDLDRRFDLALASRTRRSANGDAWSRTEAHYDSTSHSVVLGPVTIQALLADAGRPAQRYGTLGTTLAHELLHMFGAPTDRSFTPLQPTGWIDAADQPYFNGMVARLEQDYATWARTHYRASVKKSRFMGEDLSDLGSVPVALSALAQGDGADGDARDAFFRAFAGAMRTRQSEAEDQDYLATVTGHALYPYRINGPLSNLASFSRTYGCVAGDPMVRDETSRIELW